MEMNATTVMVACLFWELLWGVVGLFLAMPLMAAIKAVLAQLPEGKSWANLMATADEEPQPVILRPKSAPSSADIPILTTDLAEKSGKSGAVAAGAGTDDNSASAPRRA